MKHNPIEDIGQAADGLLGEMIEKAGAVIVRGTPIIRIIVEGGVVQDVEIIDNSLASLEVEIVDVDNNRAEGLDDYEISDTLYLVG